MAGVALAWQLRRTLASLPIPGTTSVAHLMENLAAESIDLTEDEFTSITTFSPGGIRKTARCFQGHA